jgi:AraC-like DNA-binding protein
VDGAARYRETALAGDLVAACWEVSVGRAVEDWLVLPDGAVDVVLGTGGEALVAGPATRPSVLAQAAGARTVGVRLRPGAVVAALGVRADELRDQAVPAADVAPGWRDGAARAQDALEAGDPASAAGLLAAAAIRAGAMTRAAPDPLVRRAAALLACDPGLPADALARALHVSPRHLRRRFAEQIGFGPKRYARIMRLQRLVALRAAHPDLPAGRLAADAGYADHPHLARDCRELAGRTPSALLAQRAGVALGAP